MATWSVSGIAASINPGGLLIAEAVQSDETVTVTASYSYGGVTRTATKTVTLKDVVTVPVVSLSASNILFGAQTVSTTGAARVATLTNSGTAALNTSSVSPSIADFAVAGGTCPAAPFTLNAGASCSIHLTFTPLATGPRVGALSIAGNAAGSPHAINLSGSGIAAGAGFAPALEAEWNMLGNGLEVSVDVAAYFGDPAVPVVGVTSNILSVWKWNGVGNRWAFYSPQLTSAGTAAFAASKGYDVLTTIGPKEGYWVYTAGSSLALPGLPGAATAFGFSDFDALQTGFSLISIARQLTPTEFNNTVAQLNPPLPGDPITPNFTSLWVWNAAAQKWFFYSPLLEASGGLAAVKSYADSQGYLHFQDYNKKLDIGVGFWVNK